MAIEVFGSFKTKQEAIIEVDGLSLKGIPADNITIFTLQNAEELAKKTDGNVENVEENHEGSITSKVKKVLLKISDSNKSFHDKLLDTGLSEQQASRYTEEIRSGNILVVAENKLKMGHDSVSGNEALEVPVIHRENE